MADGSGERIRVILKMVQIHDDLEPVWEDEGEFRFSATVSSRNRGGIQQKTSFRPRMATTKCLTTRPGIVCTSTRRSLMAK